MHFHIPCVEGAEVGSAGAMDVTGGGVAPSPAAAAAGWVWNIP